MSNLEKEVNFPAQYNGSVPRFSNLPVSLQNVSANYTLGVTNTSFGRGAVVANFRNGYNSVDFYYPVNQTPAAPNQIVYSFVSTALLVTIGAPVLQKFMRSSRILVSPDLSETMSVGRLAAAKLCVQANTQSTTAASLSGQIAAAAIADFRDLKDWTQSELKTLAMAKGSCFSGKRIADPSYLYLGPDVRSSLEPIDPAKCLETGKNLFIQDNCPPLVQSHIIDFGFGITSSHGVNQRITRGPRLPPGSTIRITPELYSPGNNATAYGVLWGRSTGDPAANIQMQLQLVETFTIIAGVETAVLPSRLFGQDPAFIDNGYEIMAVIVLTSASSVKSTGVEILDFYGDKNYAGWRVALWEDVGVNQSIAFSYEGAVEGIPTGILAYYRREDDLKAVGLEEWTIFQRRFADNVYTRCRNGTDSILNEGNSLSMGLFADLAGGLGHVLRGAGAGLDQTLGMKMQRPSLQMSGMHRLQMAGMYKPDSE